MLTGWEKAVFVLVLLGSLGATRTTFGNMFKIIGRGAMPINWSAIFKRIPSGILAFLGKPLFKTRPLATIVHTGVSWGFILYMLVNLIDIMYGLVSGFHFLPESIAGNIYRLFVDIFSVIVLLGIIYFLFRRFIQNDPALHINETVMLNKKARKGVFNDSALVAFFIFFHVGFRLIGASFELAQKGSDAFQPTASALASLWAGFNPGTLVFSEHVAWWLAIGLILAFIPYFPTTKHAHLFMGPLNHMITSNEHTSASFETIDFEDESLEQYGAALLEHLPQKNILDAYACIMCNRCQDACPAYITGKPLSPSAIEVNKRYYIRDHVSDLAKGVETTDRLADWMLSEDAIWACTSCGYCVEVCPVANEPMVDILRARQDLVMMESKFPKEAVTTFKNLEVNGNPWGQSAQDREKWIGELNVPKMREKGKAEYLYWVGCAGAYDARGQEVSQAMVKLMNHANVDYAVLGTEETCTGDSARRLGNEYLFQMMAQQNIDTFDNYDVTKIITQCPHCLNTLKNDYKALGKKYEVIHHAEFLAELVDQGKLSPSKASNANIAYHDSCYLGRHNDIYDAPRDVIKAIPGVKLEEFPRNMNEGMCCGAGGGRMWLEETLGDKTINIERMEDVKAVNPDEVATACPFCATMINDGIKAEELDTKTSSKDIAQYLLESIAE
ncbi:MAG: (Fe-S)-binding protein [Candidatus Marinimicrobia bacterium]|jgi:Fe-S oxidoreductase|nr:(Fe-S)-binding protein [Candidatus Neomarinimicrobiota bacterium]MBT3575347.1 (Fe-S)-binding protein [Candidatus Neomarinimicrobiota bacterium]MBT3680738.1 (Fe-S)-binding protein [Candidatus Neomarinimicrobiota bacterium]MBT3950118.1 (Fe-S)-binding protein [Candidatus Neomarinimicrobiota bacterium]MBT4253778.1 (Fe-S)-binding protein [Candidatus Neomarinimicrobiota bacterium]